MSSAGTIAGRSPRALLGVKGVGFGRRGGVDGAAPFMAAGAATALAVKTSTRLPGSRGLAGLAPKLAACSIGLALCKNKVAGARRAVGPIIARQQSCSTLCSLVSYMPLALPVSLNLGSPIVCRQPKMQQQRH